MRCYYCGEEIREGDLFCGNCGRPTAALDKEEKPRVSAEEWEEKPRVSAEEWEEKPCAFAEEEAEKPRPSGKKPRLRILAAADLLMLALNLVVFSCFILPDILQERQSTAAESSDSGQSLTGETADDSSGQSSAGETSGDSQSAGNLYEGTLMVRDGGYYLTLKSPIHAKFQSDGSETEITELALEPGDYDLSKYQWQIISVRGILSYSQGTLSLAIADSGLVAGGVTISADGSLTGTSETTE